MAKKEAKKENLVVKSKVHALVKKAGFRTGGDFYSALSDKIHELVNAAIVKVQEGGRKKTLNAEELIS